jgi:hypothetical protein
MEITKVKSAIEAAQKELNGLTDAEFQARRITSLRPLTLAAQALELAAKHVASAAKRAEPKAPKDPAAPKAAGKGK